jgi:hypothetical protein
MEIKIYKSLKIIKKTRSVKTCRGCRKDIPIGSSCISLFEFLQERYANDYFHNIDCVKKAIKEFFKNVKYQDAWLENKVNKSNLK